MAAKIHNFTAGYQPARIESTWFTYGPYTTPAFVILNDTVKEPNVYFEISPLTLLHNRLQISKVVANLNILMFVTPGEKYTQYEKFILPFDLVTWVLILVTFLITFLTIFVVNRLSKSTQNLVYGHRVETPLLNKVSIFFGISQARLPDKKFSRFILMIFVLFCLIFRTCFQSKLFEFMTSEPRKQPPKTIQDLMDRNYKVYSLRGTAEISSSTERSESW